MAKGLLLAVKNKEYEILSLVSDAVKKWAKGNYFKSKIHEN